MTYFDELCDKLGLMDVLGDAEMTRQRFFADPVGSGVLRRGTFLGWFAALLEGSEIPPPVPPAGAGGVEDDEPLESDAESHHGVFDDGGGGGGGGV